MSLPLRLALAVFAGAMTPTMAIAAIVAFQQPIKTLMAVLMIASAATLASSIVGIAASVGARVARRLVPSLPRS